MSVRPARPRPGESTDPRPTDRVPTRTCVGCRETGDRAVLLRLVVRDGEGGPAVVPDPRRRMPGRGANLHPDPACLALAVRRKAFGRAFRRAEAFDTSAVAAHLAEAGTEDASTPSQTESGFRTP